MTSSLPAEFWQGITEFNQGLFYACHDTLEALWMEAGEPQRTFYQGILQIAVGFYHLSHQNWRGAVILLGEGSNRLQDYQPDYGEINVTALISESTHWLKVLQESGPEKVAEFAALLEKVSESDDLQLRMPKIMTIGDD